MRASRRLVVAAIGTVFAVGVVGYAGAGLYVLETGTAVSGVCRSEHAAFTPAAWTANTWVSDDFSTTGFDVTPYLMPSFEDVTFPSRGDPGITIHAWWIPAPPAIAAAGLAVASPAVIVVHGLGSCRRDPAILLPAGMLHREGFGVLMMDMRDSGDSSDEDGRYGAGSDEYRDVLGAWDWLVGRGVDPSAIGAFGQSGGAPAVVNAMAEEPRFAAGWEESGPSDMAAVIREELKRLGFPEILAPAAAAWDRAFGDDIIAMSPLTEAKKIGARPFQVVHGSGDKRVSVHHGIDLAAALKAANPAATPAWIIDGGQHVQGPFRQPAEYQGRLAAFFGAALRH